MVYFFDTNALLELQERSFNYGEFWISSVSLKEIEDIKVSRNKDEQIKYKARHIAKLLDQKHDSYNVYVEHEIIRKQLLEYNLEDEPDMRICLSAKLVGDSVPNLVFISDDINCKNIARNILGLRVEGIPENTSNDAYTGFKEVTPSEEELAYFYEHITENVYELLVNEYLVIYDSNGVVIDKYRWNGLKHEGVFNKNIKSMYFDKLKSKDVYQSITIDSLMNNTLTAISGKAGSGKSLLSLMVAMHLIEAGKYDRLVVMFNPTKTRGANDLGYYSGDFIDKAMANSIGQILTTKFGDRYAIDILLQQDKLKLVSMADARGMEIRDNEILWITEAQNTSVDLIKLCLSRVSSGAKIIIEGDYMAQVDSYMFEGHNNGLKRVIDVFRGHPEFGYVQLQNVWRSKIAELCELL